MNRERTEFTGLDRMKAMAIVNIFETGRPFSEFSALVVLNDGAGLSYGINQFTHRSGSLYDVVLNYLECGGRIGPKRPDGESDAAPFDVDESHRVRGRESTAEEGPSCRCGHARDARCTAFGGA